MPKNDGRTLPDDRQFQLPFSPVLNKNFLSNHWLEYRLPLEPEWEEQKSSAEEALKRLKALWRVEQTRVSLYGDEAGLEEKFIQPVLEALGWNLKYQAYLDRREPDYALFVTDNNLHLALQAGRTNPTFWTHAAVVADSKAWHINLDRPRKVGANREYPPEQIEWYLNHSLCDYGVLTNGRLWRLVPRVLGPAKPRFQTYLEVDLPALLASLIPTGELEFGPTGAELNDFLRFYLFFGPSGFASVNERKPLVARAVEGSGEYAVAVGEELRDRVFEALRLCVEGFVSYLPNRLNPSRDLRDCWEHGLIFLYRLLFVFYAEDRGLLPYRSNQIYTKNRSLARHRDDVAARLDQVYQGVRVSDYPRTTTELWGDLNDLFDLIDRGHRRYGVHAYNGGLFDLEKDTFLAEKVIPDYYLARVLDQLGRTPQPDRPEAGLFRVDYRDLAIQQLGSVYEGLLELRPRFADKPMRVIRTRGGGPHEELIVPAEQAVPVGYQATDIVYPAASIYLATDKGERRRTGSYYTPDHIVNYIVQKSLGARCAEIDRRLSSEIMESKLAIEAAEPHERAALIAERERLESSFDDRVLSLKVLDPAMGSGHFLIRACQYLAEEIATNPHTSDHSTDDLRGDESTITFWKRRVAENCLHGVDLNPMAVELAKLALWLETAAAHSPLTFLDHHLRCGDSIIGARVGRLDSLPGDEGFLAGRFGREVAAALPSLLDPLAMIDAIPSDTAEHVKEKEQIFRRRFLPSLQRFATAGDLWSSEALFGSVIDSAQYVDLLSVMESPRGFAEVLNSNWARDALRRLRDKEIVPFHWEVAYPQVFLIARGEGRVGFDVILGNPPYDVISERESERNIDHIRRFIAVDPELQKTLGGKNNLYKLFIARSLELLSEGGYLSFIVPMAILGDEQSNRIRVALFASGEFSEIHAFPQKDNPARRVFRDAKLSSALFLYVKHALSNGCQSSFTSHVHAYQYIEANSPSLKLSRNTVGLYDPENMTIVSCGQDDWEIVEALGKQSIGRLRDYVTFFQGEVNQTVAAAKGDLTDHLHGRLVIRGANVTLYQLRTASQGDDIYLNVEKFLKDKGEATKAYHHRFERVGLQESSPQNNFRRIISCRIQAGAFCNHKINYTTSQSARISLELVLFVLNCAFSDWYFRLGSSNAAVSHYQLKNLPCPTFGSLKGRVNDAVCARISAGLADRDFGGVESICLRLAEAEGCSPTVERLITLVVRFIENEERHRGEITRSARSHLSETAEECQVILDKLMLVLLGLSVERHEFIRQRVSEMM